MPKPIIGPYNLYSLLMMLPIAILYQKVPDDLGLLRVTGVYISSLPSFLLMLWRFVWFIFAFLILRIAASASAILATHRWQLVLPDVSRHLTQTGFVSLRKCLHASTATTISRLKALIILLRNLLSWFIFRILTTANKVFYWASDARTSLAAPLTKLSSSLT
jgi:hypothetical protein